MAPDAGRLFALAGGMVLLAPLLGGPALERRWWRRAVYHCALVSAAAITTVWMLCQYAFQVRDQGQVACSRGSPLMLAYGRMRDWMARHSPMACSPGFKGSPAIQVAVLASSTLK